MRLIKILNREEYGNQGQKVRMAIFECGECGKNFKTTFNTKAKMCVSCSNRKRNTKHNLTNTNRKIFARWNAMMQRCYNKNHSAYCNYGGRGIAICEEWRNDPKSFVEWSFANGFDESLTLDRINVDGNYEPLNCRWVSRSIQQQNRRVTTKNKSGYKGVDFSKPMNKYRSRISLNRKSIILGYYENPKHAAMAYDTFVIVYGLQHTTNFPKGVFA